MKKLLAAFLLLFATASFAQSNINVSSTTGWDTEPSLAINPANSNNLVAAWMRVSGFTLAIGTSYSTDAGATWSTPTVIPHLHPGFTMADVSLVFGSGGTAYMSYIDLHPSHDSGYVMITKSFDGGMSWTAPVKVTSALETTDIPVDRPWIAVDNSGGAYDGKLYIVSKSAEDGTLPHHIWMKSSTDDGATWGTLTMLDDSIPSNLITNAMGVPAVGADGNLYVAYISYNPSQSPFPRMICLKSANGGASFIPKIIGFPASGSAISDTLYQGSYVLSANPTNANNLIYTFTDQRNGDPDILSVHSNNAGNTWNTTPVRVNKDATGNGVGQDMCWAGFSTTGKYAVAWRDRRNTGGTSSSPFEIYAGVSTDGGSTFKPDQNLSSAASPFINIQKGNDFIGLCLDDNYVFSDWCDLRSGNTEIFVNRTPMSVFTGISNLQNADVGMKVFPNPTSANATLQLHLRAPQFLTVDLADMSGNVMKVIASQLFNGQDPSIYIDTNGLAAGSYLVRVQSDGGNVIATTLLKVER
ncbi:MAG: hypothetical protein JWO44_2094 [Bacteroidetes bacterium]|nr:hypothetical protein [Bacteroidota bacterium]